MVAEFSANALASIDHPDSLHAFLRMAGHTSPGVRRAAYFGLAKLGGPDARGVLQRAATGKTESDFKSRQLAVRLLGTVGDAETVALLIELVKAKSGFVRPAADALALMTGLPEGMAGERWVEWYNEVWNPAKTGGTPPPLVPSERRAPMGFPAEGFPFIP
jgi:hypothetical protein